MEFKSYLGFLRRRWLLLLLGPTLALVAAWVVTNQMTPIYRASTTLLVVNQTSSAETIQLNDILTNERLTNTYVELVKRRSIMSRVIDQLQLSLTPDQLEAKLKVEAVSQTQLLRLSVEDPSPNLAAAIANATALQFIQDNVTEIGRPGTLSVAETAVASAKAAKPSLRVNLLLAGVLGLMATGALTLVLDNLDETVKRPEEIETTFSIPALGSIGKFKVPRRTKQAQRFPLDLPEQILEDYRKLRTNFQFINLERPTRALMVTSYGPGEGKSTTAAHLAHALAESGDRVILVDADLRKATLHRLIGTTNSYGLMGLLLNETDKVAPALVQTDIKALRVLPAGPMPPNASELLASRRMRDVIEKLRQEADFVIFDTPPIAAVSDAGILSASVDGVILVIEAGKTKIEAVRHSLRSLSLTSSKVIGAVLNKEKGRSRSPYYYSYTREQMGRRAASEPSLAPSDSSRKSGRPEETAKSS